MSDFVQLIDDSKKYTSNLPTFLERHGLLNKGIDYSVLAVLGCQSSGKSTLLNMLFQTTFPEMNETLGRTQTTKGVCVGRAKNSDVLVLDIEGTDSKERGEEDASFERKLSLFSLALSEVLLVNLWAHDIGRYNAANYSLLKTVFELNLQLFQSQKVTRTLLLFVIRDYDERTPFELLQQQLRADLIDSIWSKMAKPDQFASLPIDHFFEFAFVALPHFHYKKAEFQSTVAALRERFYDRSSESCVFRPEFSKRIPIDGFDMFASQIWEVISTNQDLNIPTQRQMLSSIRCEEIANEIFKTICLPKIESVKSVVEAAGGKKTEKNLSALFNEVLDEALVVYDEKTTLYVQQVAATKKAEFETKIREAMQMVYTQYLVLLSSATFTRFSEDMKKRVPSDKVLEDFLVVVESLLKENNEYFVQNARDGVARGAAWKHRTEEERLVERMMERIWTERKTQVNLLVDEQKTLLGSDVAASISPILNRASSNMWATIRAEIGSLCKKHEKTLETRLKAFHAKPEEVESLQRTLTSHAESKLRSIIQDAASNVSTKVSKRFSEVFRHDEKNMPRSFKKVEDIQSAFKLAKKSAFSVLDLFAFYRILEENDALHVTLSEPTAATAQSTSGSSSTSDGSNTTAPTPGTAEIVYPALAEGSNAVSLLSKDQCRDLHEKLCVESEVAFRDAEKILALSSRTGSVPLWIIGVIIVLGWNEFIAIISNPIYFLIALIVLILALWGKIQVFLAENPQYAIPVRMIEQKLGLNILHGPIPMPTRAPASGAASESHHKAD